MIIKLGMSEIWKRIEGFDTYSVSDHGEIKNMTTNKLLRGYECGGRMTVELRDNMRMGVCIPCMCCVLYCNVLYCLILYCLVLFVRSGISGSGNSRRPDHFAPGTL